MILLSVLIFLISCEDINNKGNVESLSLGKIEIDQKPDTCGNSICYNFTSIPPQSGKAKSGSIRIDGSESTKGTILMYAGGKGTSYYSYSHVGKVLIEKALEKGFRVIQIKWNEGWLEGSEEQFEGCRKLAVHPATITRYIFDGMAKRDQSLILLGGSGGAAQIAYMLSFYGIDAITDKAIIFSGFWMGRIDIGCFDKDPINEHLHYSEKARIAIDESFGFSPDKKGPCQLCDTSFTELYKNSSISIGGNYNYPTTEIFLFYGGRDQVGALNQGITYYEQLIKAGSPNVHIQIVEGSAHSMLGDSIGNETITRAPFSEVEIKRLSKK